MTAAHCIYNGLTTGNPGITAEVSGEVIWEHCKTETNVSTAELEIRLGEHDRSSSGESSITKTYSASLMIKHPSYSSATSTNDIALVNLATKADIGLFTPVCLPSAEADFAGQLSTLTG